jgi:mono/diheme cytochrome c family protein
MLGAPRIGKRIRGGFMFTGWKWFAATLVGGALVLGACGSKKSESEEGAQATSGGEPEIVVADQAEWSQLVASGQATFDNSCGSCHPGGEADLGPKLKDHAEPIAKMRKQIRKGSGRMAPIGEDRLPESDMKGLLVYLASIDAVEGVKRP